MWLSHGQFWGKVGEITVTVITTITVIYSNFNQKLIDSLTRKVGCSAWSNTQCGLKHQLFDFNMSYPFSRAKISRSCVATITFHVISLNYFQHINSSQNMMNYVSKKIATISYSLFVFGGLTMFIN